MITIEEIKDLEDVKTPEETQDKLKGSYIVPGNLNAYLDQICQKYQNVDLVQIMRYLPQFVDNYLSLIEREIWINYYNKRQTIQEIKYHLHLNSYGVVTKALRSIDKKFKIWIKSIQSAPDKVEKRE